MRLLEKGDGGRFTAPQRTGNARIHRSRPNLMRGAAPAVTVLIHAWRPGPDGALGWNSVYAYSSNIPLCRLSTRIREGRNLKPASIHRVELVGALSRDESRPGKTTRNSWVEKPVSSMAAISSARPAGRPPAAHRPPSLEPPRMRTGRPRNCGKQ